MSDLTVKNNLQTFLEDAIPSVKDLRFQLNEVSESQVRAQAPLIANSNHMGTAFGGSLYSLLVLTCYSWLYSILNQRGLSCEIVIQTGSIQYIKPVTQTIETLCQKPENKKWDQFLSALEKRGKARLILSSFVFESDEAAVQLDGTFVVLLKKQI